MDGVIINEFELQRQQLIARNRARLLALGIPEAVSGLAKLAPKQAQHKKRKASQAAAAAAAPAAPSRQSTRLRDQAMIARGEVPPDVEQGSELALFIIDGECPRCGKVLSSGHARHLLSCKGPPEPPTEEEIAAQAEDYKLQQKDKLRQLELGGLVDYQPAAHIKQQQQQDEQASPAKRRKTAGDAGVAEQQEQELVEEAGRKGESGTQQQRQQKGERKGKQSTGKSSTGGAKKKQGAAAAAAAASGEEEGGAHATFIVIGSTGNHYVVKLSDAKRSCTCMDHRIRRRDCKHIRLILEQLDVADAPQDWQQALQRLVSDLAAAEPADVDMVRQAEARAAARRDKAAAAAAGKRAASEQQT